MNIVYEKAPKSIAKIVRGHNNAIQAFISPTIERPTKTPREVPLGTHRIYFLPLLSLVSEERLDLARPIGWRHLSIRDDEVLETIIESISDRQFRNPQHRKLALHPRSVSVHRELRQLGARLRGSFELRALCVPPLMTLGLWLKSRTTGTSKIIPVHSVVQALIPGQPVAERRFFSLLKEPARQLLEYAEPLTLPIRVSDKLRRRKDKSA